MDRGKRMGIDEMIEVVPYDERWVSLYEGEKEKIEKRWAIIAHPWNDNAPIPPAGYPS